MTKAIKIGAMGVLGTLAMATAAHGQNVPALTDLIGARGSSAESELTSRGYTFVKNWGAAALWWNARTRTCASVAVNSGRVESIQQGSARDCGQSASANPGYQNQGVPAERTAVAQMPRFCAGAAASKFGQSPRNISTQMPVPDHGMYSVFGQYPPNGAGTVFICTFAHDGTLVGVDKE